MKKYGKLIIIIVIIGMITYFIDSKRVREQKEPKFVIKIISENGSKVSYFGLGYKVVCYVGVSPKEPFKSNIGLKMGTWFMKYELLEDEKILYNGEITEEKFKNGEIFVVTILNEKIYHSISDKFFHDSEYLLKFLY